MTAALPPAGHLRDELAELAWGVLVVCQREGVTDLNVIAHSLVSNQLPVVARALTEARADELEQATADWHVGRFVPGVGSGVPSFDAGIVAARNELRVRATSLRASIRQTDERNDR